jgi:hypothetical protein
LYLQIALPDVVGAAGSHLLDGGFEPRHLLAQTAGCGLGGSKRSAGRALLRLGEGDLSREVLIACLELLEGERLAGGLGAKVTEGTGDGIALFLVALQGNALVFKSARLCSRIAHTSRFNIRSCTRLMI